MADYKIPFDIQEEIIKRLPIKSLIRFTSVSKPWKSFIHSSKFIAGYQQTQRLLVSYSDDTYSYYDHIKYVSVVDDDTYPQPQLTLTGPMSVDLLRKDVLVGSSQGLFCFYNDCSYKPRTKTAIIWNPTIRKSVYIVVPKVLNMCPYKTFFGFGVCPQTCDPKLVKIISDRRIQSKYSIPWQVEVFMLSSGVWKRLSTNLPRKSIWFLDNHVDIDGFIYWRVVDRSYLDGRLRRNNMIMSFDLKSTEFAEIYLPSSLSNYDDEIPFKVSKLRESLAVLEWKMMAAKRVYGVWMMDNGDPKSFTKLYTIDSPDGSSITKVPGFSKSGKPIIVMKKKRSKPNALSVYEPNSKDINHIGISGKQTIRFAISFTETLLLLDH